MAFVTEGKRDRASPQRRRKRSPCAINSGTPVCSVKKHGDARAMRGLEVPGGTRNTPAVAHIQRSLSKEAGTGNQVGQERKTRTARKKGGKPGEAGGLDGERGSAADAVPLGIKQETQSPVHTRISCAPGIRYVRRRKRAGVSAGNRPPNRSALRSAR